MEFRGSLGDGQRAGRRPAGCCHCHRPVFLVLGWQHRAKRRAEHRAERRRQGGGGQPQARSAPAPQQPWSSRRRLATPRGAAGEWRGPAVPPGVPGPECTAVGSGAVGSGLSASCLRRMTPRREDVAGGEGPDPQIDTGPVPGAPAGQGTPCRPPLPQFRVSAARTRSQLHLPSVSHARLPDVSK